MQAIQLQGKSKEELNAMLDSELVLSKARGTQMVFTRNGEEQTLTMLQATNRRNEARKLATMFDETHKMYATYTTLANEYTELLKQFRALTINNDEWRAMALGEYGNTEELLKVVIDYNFECDSL